MSNPTCPSCNQPAKLVTGATLFPFNVATLEKMFWACTDCDTRVGCHPHSIIPLGTMAGQELRWWRTHVHELLDRVWKDIRDKRKQRAKRDRAYERLATAMNLTREQCHIGSFTIEQCRQAAAYLEQRNRGY